MNYRSLFSFSSDQRKGIFVLLFLIVALQGAYWFWVSKTDKKPSTKSKAEWMAMQVYIDSLKEESSSATQKIYPFNPNFITDYRGYQLGMTTAELDRLFAFRKENKYVNSAKEFQQVTQVSDSLLQAISPYFKFPSWVSQPKATFKFKDYSKPKKEVIVRLDINQASQDDLIKLYGIGPALSERILKQKEIFGGFVSMDQMDVIWGLSPEVVENLKKHFEVQQPPAIKKIKINDLSTKELAKFPYFNYAISKEIVTFRSMNNGIKGIEDLTKIKGFPVEKLNIIALYLEF
ncbi:ComEA family DNA-binding protein [Flavobacterium sp. UBA6135]|uniref:ComEA family DNA-binding protein n=1 Tax=Flavobacterium sp. UBA6135 TaxID=1946553 RepID=UPI0025C44E04|nr:helix-hairpin-helix domain-containing protein [Flavobacterium sp. UBA6135]